MWVGYLERFSESGFVIAEKNCRNIMLKLTSCFTSGVIVKVLQTPDQSLQVLMIIKQLM